MQLVEDFVVQHQKVIMGERIVVFLLLIFSYLLLAVAETANWDFIALRSLKDIWQNTPPNWVGSDPCGDGWDGIKCSNSRVTSITLSSINLTGQLSGDLKLLSELQTLDLSYNKGLTGPLPQEIGNLKKLSNLILVGCGFTGPIPDSIGQLQQLFLLSLNSNRFSGQIPPSIGNLSKLYWLDLADNLLHGSIPVSNSTAPGLDKLHHTKHFHFGKNMLSGRIPPQLFSTDMTLIHVLFESNQLTGDIPSTLGLVKTLEVVRFDHNFLSESVPPNLNNLTNVQELYLSNNTLSGSLPNLTGMEVLSYLDLSNNSFDQSPIPSWISTLQSLKTIIMEQTQLQGQVPISLFSLVHLQTVVLKGNQINGTLDIGTTNNNQLQLIDLQNNFIDEFKQEEGDSKVKILLMGNPICQETGVVKTYCSSSQPDISYTTPPNNCLPVSCSSEQILSPICKCAHPYAGTLIFRAPAFSDWGNKTYYVILEQSLMQSFQSHYLPVDSVALSNPTQNQLQYLELTVQVFPIGQDHFNRTGILSIGFLLSTGFLLSNQPFISLEIFGTYYFIGEDYRYFGVDSEGPMESSKSSNIGVIVGAAIGGSVLFVLLVIIVVYTFFQKKWAKRATGQRYWDPNESNKSLPQLKGARCFSFEEIQKYTRNFSQANDIGSGGYGKVYRGTLPNGQLIAVKRAQKDSIHGELQFKTEIELLSRVHHKNLVSLVGFCLDRGEQMLIYEYVPNGTLKDAISGKSGIRLDWIRRLKLALGAARGLAYLHELANPPIIHRDIKSTNILLDEHLNAKVSDFGLGKPMGFSEQNHVTTEVKGTMGYLDPEYCTTQLLTPKSDVYSFGVLMLELITARKPIEHGKYIVKIVKNAIDKSKDLYGLREFLDPAISTETTLRGFDEFVDLAMKCVEESGGDRPTMNDIVKEIENMLQSAGSNLNAGSASISSSFEVSKGSSHHPYSNEICSSAAVPR